MRLNQKDISEGGIGVLTNILSNDVNRFDDVIEFIPFVFIGPLQAAVVAAVLWGYIGPACVPGLATIIILIPIQG